MGVRITAYSRVQVTEPHEVADTCWDVEPYHLQAFVYDGFEQSARGLELGRCYVPTEATTEREILALSYTAYNVWRDALSQAVHGVPSSTLQDHPDWPLYELLWFADNEGTIGPEAALDLLVDFETLPDLGASLRAQLPEGWTAESRDHSAHLVGEWMTGLRLAADGGLVMFS